MNEKEKDLQRMFQELLPRSEELRKKTAAQIQRLQQLRNDIQEAKAELQARKENTAPPPWPGAIEPLVLAASFLVGADADVDSITQKVLELGSRAYALPAIRSTIHHLVRRELLSENDRCFTITPRGERQLAQARDDAKRWIEALGERPGPAGPRN
jgi:hypothetical protein